MIVQFISCNFELGLYSEMMEHNPKDIESTEKLSLLFPRLSSSKLFVFEISQRDEYKQKEQLNE